MKIKQLKYIITAFLMGLLSVFFGGGICVNAESKSYSNVADDLRKDDNFNAWEYPAKATDYSLQVIQIAESAAGELFVYVYQPSGAVADLRATCINMTLSEEVNGTDLYNLKYLNSSGVFYKYIAEGVKVSSAAERLYNITSIYREWNGDYDKGTGNDNTIDEVVFEVGKLFRVTTKDGKLVYENVKVETIIVTSKYVNYIRYKDGTSGLGVFMRDYTDSHFVAFTTDKRIDKLLEAKVTFVTQKRKINKYPIGGVPDKEYLIGDPVSKTLLLKDTDFASNSVGGWIPSKKYTWSRIQSATKFCAENSLLSGAVDNILSKQWVLRFYETDYKSYTTSADTETIEDTKVSEVSILQLKFETLGKVYNLGVVDNKQSGHLNVAGCQGLKWFEMLLIVVFSLVVFWAVFKLISLLVEKLRG